MNTPVTNQDKPTPVIMTVFAYLAALFLGLGTYDISVHFSPPMVKLLFFTLPKEFIGLMSIGLVDGVYILLDFMLPKFKTKKSRQGAIYFLMFIWVIMASTNVSSAVINNQTGNEALGSFSFVVYGIKFGALVFLAFYTFVRYDDPATQREIIEVEINSALDQQINHFEKMYGQQIGKYGGEMIGLVKGLESYRGAFMEKTGKDVRTTLGVNWQRVLAKQVGFHVPEGFVFSDEPIVLTADDAGTDEDPTDAGTPPRKSRKAVPAPAPQIPDAGNVTNTPDAGNLEKPQRLIPNLLQAAAGLVKKATQPNP